MFRIISTFILIGSFLLTSLWACSLTPETRVVSLSAAEPPLEQNGNVRILKTIQLNFNKHHFHGISGLAWDAQEQKLYAISDDARLFHLNLALHKGSFNKVKVEAVYPLKGKHGKPLASKKQRDAEGLSLVTNTNGQKELLISFERKPRIERYTLMGKYLGTIPLPTALKSIEHYRDDNAALESVTHHTSFGVLTSTEKPLSQFPEKAQRVYDMRGNTCEFKAAAAENSYVTAIEATPDGHLIILERAWAGPIKPMIITLKKLRFREKNLSSCVVENLASLSTADQWSVDNFEGLTHFTENTYLMISDDNANPMQDTLLVHFEILK
jgi:hypothetical protein